MIFTGILVRSKGFVLIFLFIYLIFLENEQGDVSRGKRICTEFSWKMRDTK